MNSIDFKLQLICDISFLNEYSSALKKLPFTQEEKEKLHQISLSFLDGSSKDDDLLLSFQQKEFLSCLLRSIEDLAIWVKEKHYLSWEDDDVNFLNFLLHSPWLYSKEMQENYPEYLIKLIREILLPFILAQKKEDPFYSDISFWFRKEGKDIFQSLNLENECQMILKHFQEEK